MATPSALAWKKILSCLLISQLITPLTACYAGTDTVLSERSAQTADLLGIRSETENIIRQRNSNSDMSAVNGLRGKVLRKIMHASMQVQMTENRLESEMAYAYDLIARQERKTNTINQLFNVFNFLQFGILYTIEPYSRIHKQFTQSAVCTSVGAGLGIGLPLMCIFYNKFSKANNLAPPKFLSRVIDGKPVDGSQLTPLLVRYFDLSAPGANQTRREAMNAVWKQRYHADLANKSSLCGIDDGKSKSPFVLNSRVMLLWSLYTYVQDLDRDILALLTEIRGTQFATLNAGQTSVQLPGLSPDASQAAQLLGVESVVRELQQRKDRSAKTEELQLDLLEAILAGDLTLKLAVNRCQEELNYQYDVVLSSMNARRGKFLQKTYEANFIQTGTLGACAGWSYLNHYPKAGNELFIIADSIGLGITTISLLATHGGWKKNQRPPNSLADFFELRDPKQNEYSPLVTSFLNSPSTHSKDGKSRRQHLMEVWQTKDVSTVNLNNKTTLAKVGSMPSCKWDSIKTVRNRIALLSSLRETFGQFDGDLLALLRGSWSADNQFRGAGPVSNREPVAAAAELLNVSNSLDEIRGSGDSAKKLNLTRDVLEGYLDTASTCDSVSHQILKEQQVMDRMIRTRDMIIQMTNILNFYQIGLLGVTADSLGLSKNDQYVLDGNRINIISGLMVSCLAVTALLERHGGYRPSKAEPNGLAAVFGQKSEYKSLSPLMVRYLNSPSPTVPEAGSRREALIQYWKSTKVLGVNVNKNSNVEKLSAEGRAHHWWSETIKLIHNRITMLYSLRATLRTSIIEFDALLETLD